MTNEERLQWLKHIEQDIYVSSLESTFADDMKSCAIHSVIEDLEKAPKDAGKVSDGYHTFNQLYHQRAILFATIVNQNKDVAWKSYKHSDGKYCFHSNGEWFIVGVDTPKGSYTYHYSKEYWDYFDCQELDCGKEWDGHTEADVTRLLSLCQGYFEDAVSREAVQEAVEKTIAKYIPIFIGRYEELPLEVAMAIKGLPLVKPSRKRGKWLVNKERDTICCPFCNDKQKIGKDEVELLKTAFAKFNFCTYCGAEMRGFNE